MAITELRFKTLKQIQNQNEIFLLNVILGMSKYCNNL